MFVRPDQVKVSPRSPSSFATRGLGFLDKLFGGKKHEKRIERAEEANAQRAAEFEARDEDRDLHARFVLVQIAAERKALVRNYAAAGLIVAGAAWAILRMRAAADQRRLRERIRRLEERVS